MERSPTARPCLSEFWNGRVNCERCQAPIPMPLQPVSSFLAPRALLEAGAYSLPAGATLFRDGEPAEHVFSVRQGFLKLWRTDCTGKCRIVRLLGPGDMAGLEAMVQPAYGLTAAALSPVQLCKLPRELLQGLERDHTSLYRDIERRWHAQLQRTDTLLLEVITGPARERITKLLKYLADLAAPEPCPRVRRLDMAALLDVAPETVARVVAELKRGGLLVESTQHLLFDPRKM